MENDSGQNLGDILRAALERNGNKMIDIQKIGAFLKAAKDLGRECPLDLLSRDEVNALIDHLVNYKPVPIRTLDEQRMVGATILNPERITQKIYAIKAIREITGLGLKESKDFVEGNYRALPLYQCHKIQDYLKGTKDYLKAHLSY